MGLLREPAPVLSTESRIKEIRQAMLDTLAGLGTSHAQTKLGLRVMYASDIQALWYLRGDVMAMLAKPLGETAAKARIATITAMFDGLLPSAQKSRPSRLHK